MKKSSKINIILISSIFIGSLALAHTPKQALKANGQLIYNKSNNEGHFYGRLRNNNFYYAYKNNDTSHSTQLVSGIGASIIYKSAIYNGFDFNIALYGANSFFDNSRDPVTNLKSSKDVLSRFNYVNTGSKSLAVIGQENISYKLSKTKFTLGRQLVETFYTKSNDTKMVPNTFDGLVMSTKNIKNSKLKLAYLYKQKLRDHTTAHSVLVYGDVNSSSSLKPQWSQNDDSAMHKGLTYSALKAASKPTDAPLIVLDFDNKSFKNTKINFSSYVVPELLSQVMGEINYKINFHGFSITPAFRYIQQFDYGAGAVGGASLTKKGLSAYKNPSSLNAQMIAMRVVAKVDDYKINLGYTNILNKADLVTPWRAFPTAGYTRSMGIYNWRANTKSYRLEIVKGAKNNGIYKSPFIQTSILYIDGDKEKLQNDKLYSYAGIVQNIPSMPELQYRVRLGYMNFIGDSSSISDYIDSRLEFNYLF